MQMCVMFPAQYDTEVHQKFQRRVIEGVEVELWKKWESRKNVVAAVVVLLT